MDIFWCFLSYSSLHCVLSLFLSSSVSFHCSFLPLFPFFLFSFSLSLSLSLSFFQSFSIILSGLGLCLCACIECVVWYWMSQRRKEPTREKRDEPRVTKTDQGVMRTGRDDRRRKVQEVCETARKCRYDYDIRPLNKPR